MKVEVVTDAEGVPIGVATGAADLAETDLIGPALDSIPEAIALPAEVPVVADKAYDSDPLRAELAEDGYILLSPHRKNRTKPRTNDGRRMRRYKRRWKVEHVRLAPRLPPGPRPARVLQLHLRRLRPPRPRLYHTVEVLKPVLETYLATVFVGKV